MEIVDCTAAFFEGIKEDIKMVMYDGDAFAGDRETRIKALAFKIFGAIALIFAAVVTFSLAATFVLQPLTNTLLLLLFVPLIPLSYDHVVIGNNLIKEIEEEGEESQEGENEPLPLWCRDTLLYRRVYSLIHSGDER